MRLAISLGGRGETLGDESTMGYAERRFAGDGQAAVRSWSRREDTTRKKTMKSDTVREAAARYSPNGVPSEQISMTYAKL
jgi:hypothetical protein